MRLLALSALAFSLATPAVAAPIEQPFSGRRPLTLGVHAGFAWYGNGVAFGARLGVPLVHNGFVSTINNSVYLSVGADVYNADYGGSRGFAVGGVVSVRRSGFQPVFRRLRSGPLLLQLGNRSDWGAVQV